MDETNRFRWPNISTTTWLGMVEDHLGRDVNGVEYERVIQLFGDRKTPDEAAAILTDEEVDAP